MTSLRRMFIWGHNACRGHVEMDLAHMRNIQQRTSTTPEAKALALKIENLLYELREALKTRIDP
jgi:hypothetical protein